MTCNRSHSENFKAGAPMCPFCFVEYEELEVDFEYEGIILRRIKILRCPICQEELFTPEQQATLKANFWQTQK
ncbi:MAG: hypothetical protein N3D85_00830 [Candidatus Bathyarchaeota archaeon]|nr:hypothetical protein [Candidatus Bathyarchaeota archaeon]